MIFWRCYYHFVWATKNREPLLDVAYEPTIFRVVRDKTAEYDSQVLAINAVSDHIHIAVALHPKVTISEWVKRVKGASSHAVNTALSPETDRFRWQRGYGVLTFGKSNLPMVVDYIQRQKEHHASGSIIEYMEQSEE